MRIIFTGTAVVVGDRSTLPEPPCCLYKFGVLVEVGVGFRDLRAEPCCMYEYGKAVGVRVAGAVGDTLLEPCLFTIGLPKGV